MKSILDPSFKYVSSVATDVRKTFARARREIRHRERLALRAGRKAQAQPEETGQVHSTAILVAA